MIYLHQTTHTLCRFRQWLERRNKLCTLLSMINQQLEQRQLKVCKGHIAIVGATIIQTAGDQQKKAIEVDTEGRAHNVLPSKDTDARWVKKDGLFKPGYRQHTRTDGEGYITDLTLSPANEHETNHLTE